MKFKQRGHVNSRIVYQGVKGFVGFESAKKGVSYIVIESILNCGWELWAQVYELKGKKLSIDDFWRRIARSNY